ncbi:HEPN domain-containing protein [Flagellimonas halotolerans]|uniref:HEPN domain-containing protein n=1 Tax=Flagellimonas halotolerans TaxID=3112164 RepID=A0ABU6ITB4_9FLAO|nr:MULTISPECIES: HEPN domain-containing protein [unclassified Allomuricauda]MEC3966482.1 HEPN domain-containing protein [Muricauda sp. SYSU M86414]MEC4266381.1 HEPN domain-containing protein [Muricauda sp. SYSU M84420]
MTHGTNIPKHFEKSEELSELLDSILNIITIDRAFLSRKQNEGNSEYYFLTLFVDVNNDPLPNEIRSLVAKKGKKYPDFRIRVYTENQSETGLERGSLYFLEHCCLGKTVFAHPEGENIMDYSTMAYETLMKRATRYHKSELAKVNAFANTANILIKERDYAIATFNMHQAFELSFRFIEQMCIGRSMVTHSIISHINYCKQFFPTLQPFLESSDIKNNELLLLLEHAYSVARYGNEFEITKVETKTIQSQMKEFIQEVEYIFNRHLDQCKEHIEGIEKDFEKAFPKVAEEVGNNNEASLVDQLKELEKEHFFALKPYIPEKGLYSIDLITEGYGETSFIISDLIKVCITTLENENFSKRSVPQPHSNISGVLGYILDLIPHDEMAFLDKVRKLLSEQKTTTTK